MGIVWGFAQSFFSSVVWTRQIDFFLFCPTDNAAATEQSVVSEIKSAECSKLNFCKPLGQSNK
jgi:hypothetical protein